MKTSKKQIKQIIQEEIGRVLESFFEDSYDKPESLPWQDPAQAADIHWTEFKALGGTLLTKDLLELKDNKVLPLLLEKGEITKENLLITVEHLLSQRK